MQQARSGNHGQGCVQCQLSGGWSGHIQAHDLHLHYDYVLHDYDHDHVHYDPDHHVCHDGSQVLVALTECDCVLSQ